MPKISVITAAYGPSAHHLAEAARSVQAQQLPPGWSLEWVVQEDGDNPVLANMLGAHAHYDRNGTRLGIAATRNLALARATGALVQNLDHDDVLLPHALATLIARFEQHPIHWAVGAADDLLEDGTRQSWDSALPFGLIPAGHVNQWAEQHGGNWPVHGGGLMMRTDTLRAIGGWTGIPVDDDLAALAAISELADGWNDRTVTWLYRKHRAQTTQNSLYAGLEDTGRRIALQRAKAIRNIAGPTLSTGAAFDSDSADVEVGPNIKLTP
ncbi:glycosyltransferase involved in cell wall biosynthesis [Saccharothrix coeruleofusca]|uniref:glycosyltransferase family 2 protein n=1 Tax=Saccharothrix coeruleofusca TaxID=33919 RepID=UPI001AE69C24|nr:glycosyltransferase [Saccharothrix coeruleofusca]MBP2337398.1 glycosyltransferase involved in cell wall biosynthesis [Saccharothrix coeruleofusca]